MSGTAGWAGARAAILSVTALIVLLNLGAALFPAQGLPLMFFLRQDRFVLVGFVLLLILLRREPLPGERPLATLDGPKLAMLLGFVVVLCWGGHHLVMLDYDLSRDEVLASFAAPYLREGRLFQPVPAEWQPFSQALMWMYMHPAGGDVAWISGYLPVNSLWRGLVSWVADPALANPLMLAMGLVALWRVARRLFPDRPDAVTATLILGATSAQVLTLAMTSYAMTGHFALNMLWLALFLRGGKAGHGLAMLVAVLAMGLHQVHLHPLFAGPFLLHLLLVRKERWTFAAYCVAYLAAVALWMEVYPKLLAELVGPIAVAQATGLTTSKAQALLARLSQVSPGAYTLALTRFIAWNNPLLLPLAVLAARRRAWREGLVLPLLGAVAIGLVTLVEQGHGWGYRYLNGLLGAFCLLAGYGWTTLVGDRERARGAAALRIAAAAVALVSLPFQLWQANRFVAPYARSLAAIRAAPADVVIVDPRGAFYLEDLVRNGTDFSARPKIMDLWKLDEPKLDRLCASYRVMLFGRRQAMALGMNRSTSTYPDADAMTAGRAYLRRIGCAPPVPLPRQRQLSR